MVVRAMFGLAISLCLMGFAQTPFQFVLIRFFQGIFGGVVDAAAAFAGSEAPEGKRGRSLGSLQGAVAAGSLAGPLTGGFFVDLWGFRELLLIMALLTGITTAALAFLLREGRQPPNINGTEEHTGVFLTFQNLFRAPKVRAFILAGICAKLGIFGLVTVFAPLVRDLVDSPAYAATWVGALQAVMWGATFLGSPWWGKNNDRGPVERNFIRASVLCGVSILLQAFVESVEWLFVLRFLQGFGFSALIQSVLFIVVQASEEGNRGVHVGATNSLLVFGQIMGSIFGSMLGGFLRPEWVFGVMGCVFIFGSWIVWMAVRPHRQHSSNTPLKEVESQR